MIAALMVAEVSVRAPPDGMNTCARLQEGQKTLLECMAQGIITGGSSGLAVVRVVLGPLLKRNEGVRRLGRSMRVRTRVGSEQPAARTSALNGAVPSLVCSEVHQNRTSKWPTTGLQSITTQTPTGMQVQPSSPNSRRLLTILPLRRRCRAKSRARPQRHAHIAS